MAYPFYCILFQQRLYQPGFFFFLFFKFNFLLSSVLEHDVHIHPTETHFATWTPRLLDIILGDNHYVSKFCCTSRAEALREHLLMKCELHRLSTAESGRTVTNGGFFFSDPLSAFYLENPFSLLPSWCRLSPKSKGLNAVIEKKRALSCKSMQWENWQRLSSLFWCH